MSDALAMSDSRSRREVSIDDDRAVSSTLRVFKIRSACEVRLDGQHRF